MSILLTFFYVNYEVVDAANNASEYSSSSVSKSNSSVLNNEQNNSSTVKEKTNSISITTNNLFSPGARSDLRPVPLLRSSLPDIYPTDKNRPNMDFIDISSNNGLISVSDFMKMKSYGITGVVVKLTESTSYINPLAKSQITNYKC